MLRENEREKLEKKVRFFQFIWAVAMIFDVILVAVCYFYGNQIRDLIGPIEIKIGSNYPMNSIANILIIIGLVIVFSAHFVKKFILKNRQM